MGVQVPPFARHLLLENTGLRTPQAFLVRALEISSQLEVHRTSRFVVASAAVDAGGYAGWVRFDALGLAFDAHGEALHRAVLIAFALFDALAARWLALGLTGRARIRAARDARALIVARRAQRIVWATAHLGLEGRGTCLGASIGHHCIGLLWRRRGAGCARAGRAGGAHGGRARGVQLRCWIGRWG